MKRAMTLGEVLGEWADREPVRHPVVRRGEREPIPWIVRLSIARRDGFRCRLCSHELPDMTGMELDHLLPWSAGGGDHSGNLRSLCSRCNQTRSNWEDGDHEREMVPTTWWCETCWLDPDVEAQMPDDFLDTYGSRQRHRQAWRSGIDLTAAPFVRELTTLAYCAWCWGYGMTDQAFTPDNQGRLAELVTYREPEERP